MTSVGTVEELEPGDEQHGAEDCSQEQRRRVRGDCGSDQDAGNASDQYRKRQPKREIAEQNVRERGGADHRNRLRQVGTDHMGSTQPWIQEEQEDDHQVPEPTDVIPTMNPIDAPMARVGAFFTRSLSSSVGASPPR